MFSKNKKLFIFSSVGTNHNKDYKNKVFDSWDVKKYNSLCVKYNINDKFNYEYYFDGVITKSGSKFLNLFFCEDCFKIFEKYKYFAVMDDDLLYKKPDSFEKIINLMENFDLDLCSASNDCTGERSWHKIMNAEDPVDEIWISNFCEMGGMFISGKLLSLVKEIYKNNYLYLVDFGMDIFISNICDYFNLKIGIVKNLFYHNPERVELNKRNYGREQYEKNKINKFLVRQEIKIFDKIKI